MHFFDVKMQRAMCDCQFNDFEVTFGENIYESSQIYQIQWAPLYGITDNVINWIKLSVFEVLVSPFSKAGLN
jgi:hypothetical protein